MRSAKSLIGMPVVLGNKKLGRVARILPNDSLTAVRGMEFSRGFGASRLIECADLDVVGDVVVLVRSAGCRTSNAERPLFRRALLPDGSRIGAVTDLLLDEKTLRIEALELTRGYPDDLLRGRSHIRQYCIGKGGDVIVDPSEGGKSE